MISSFRSKALQAFFETGRTIGIHPPHVARLRLILARLHVAKSARDMALPGLRLHSLKGNLRGYWAVEVSGNWRVIFSFQGQDVVKVDYLDYHS